MRFREIEKIILADGWQFKKAKGSHYSYTHPTKPGKVTIPNHPGDLDPRTSDILPPPMRSIEAGASRSSTPTSTVSTS